MFLLGGRLTGVIVAFFVATCGCALGRQVFAGRFVRGDADGDGGVSASDALAVFRHLFGSRAGAPVQLPCLDAADADDNGRLEITDGIFLLDHIFRGGEAPPSPFRACWADPTIDALDCAEYTTCPPAFFGREIDADGNFFFAVLDRSLQNRGEIHRLERELVWTLSTLPAGGEFAVVFVDSRVLSFPGDGQAAVVDEASISEAVRFIEDAPEGQGSCLVPGLEALLEIAEASTAGRKTLWIIASPVGLARIDFDDEGISLEALLSQLGLVATPC